IFAEMDLFACIQVADPTKVMIGERERDEEEAKLLDSTTGRVVSLLPVAPARSKNELEASWKDCLKKVVMRTRWIPLLVVVERLRLE
nr:hypothetical protein [Tanacetum cinerariifolium]